MWRILRAFVGATVIAALSYVPIILLLSVVGAPYPTVVARGATATVSTLTFVYLLRRSRAARSRSASWTSEVERPAALRPATTASAASSAPPGMREAVPFADVRAGGFPRACTCIPERCGRPAVERCREPGRGEVTACEGCRLRIRATTDQAWSMPLVPDGIAWAYCECACGHVALARLETMDRAGQHLRCGGCAASGHVAAQRPEAAFAADPRFPPRAVPAAHRGRAT